MQFLGVQMAATPCLLGKGVWRYYFHMH